MGTQEKTASQWRSHVLSLAFPIMVSNVTVPLVGIVDTAVMGRMEDPEYLAATAIGAVVFSSIYWIFGFLRMGTSGLVAQAFGAHDHEDMRQTTIRALVVGACLAAILLLLQTPLLGFALWSMAGNEALDSLVVAYFQIRILSAPATLMLYSIRGALIGQQAMRRVLGLELILNGLNIVLNIVFFTYTDWNIRGVAWATVIAEYVTLIVGLWWLWPRLQPVVTPVISGHANLAAPLATPRQDARESVRRWQDWLFDRQALSRFAALSSDLFIRTLCLTGAFYWLTVCGSKLGLTVLAANAILIQMLHFMAHGLDGFSHAAEALTGQAIGQRNPDRLKRAVKAATEMALVLALLFVLAYGLGGPYIIDLMTTQTDTRVAAREWLPWIVLGPLVGVWSFLLDGIFIGATRTRDMRNGMLLSVAVFLAATVILIPFMGNHGLWLAYTLLLLVRAVTLLLRYPQVIQAAVRKESASDSATT